MVDKHTGRVYYIHDKIPHLPNQIEEVQITEINEEDVVEL